MKITAPGTLFVNMMVLLLSLMGFLLSQAADAQDEIVVARGDGSWPPYEMMDGGQLAGFHIDLVRAVAERIDVKVIFKTYPWVRAMTMAKRGQVDAITYVARNNERARYLHFLEGNVLSGTTHYLIQNRYSRAIHFDGNLSQLKDYSVAFISGYTLGQEFDQAGYIKKNPVKTVEQVVRLVAAGRYDLGVVNPVDLKGSNLSAWLDQTKRLPHPLHSTEVYIGFSVDNDEMAERFSEAMTLFRQTPAYQQLLDKYRL